MVRENKKEGVAMLHREAILAAAEKLFTEKVLLKPPYRTYQPPPITAGAPYTHII